MRSTPAARNSCVELTMGEDWLVEEDSHVLEGLTLALVDGHGESGQDGELSTSQVKRQQCIAWRQVDPRNEYDITL